MAGRRPPTKALPIPSPPCRTRPLRRSSPSRRRCRARAPRGARRSLGYALLVDRAAHAGAADAAIAGRVLGEILLVVVLGEIELRRRQDLGGNRPACLA